MKFPKKPVPPRPAHAPGFSLVETLVAMGIVTLVMAGIATFVSYLAKTNRSTLQRGEIRNLSTEVKQLLDDQRSCTLNFGNSQYQIGGGSQSVAVPAVYYIKAGALDTTHPIAKTAQYYRNDPNGIQVTGISLNFKAQLGMVPTQYSQPPLPPTQIIDALNLTLNTSRASPQGVVLAAGTAAVSVTLPLLAVVDSSGNILSCFADALSSGVSNLDNTICETSSAGGEFYVPGPNGTPGTCAGKCFTSTGTLITPNMTTSPTGNPLTASCPNGMTLITQPQFGNPCQPQGGTPPANDASTTGTYGSSSGSFSETIQASPGNGMEASSTSCTCLWQPGATPGVCSACCSSYDVAKTGP